MPVLRHLSNTVFRLGGDGRIESHLGTGEHTQIAYAFVPRRLICLETVAA